MGFNETWLNDSKVSSYSINGYDHLYHHRKYRPGGGVSLYVKNYIKYILRQDLLIRDAPNIRPPNMFGRKWNDGKLNPSS